MGHTHTWDQAPKTSLWGFGTGVWHSCPSRILKTRQRVMITQRWKWSCWSKSGLVITVLLGGGRRQLAWAFRQAMEWEHLLRMRASWESQQNFSRKTPRQDAVKSFTTPKLLLMPPDTGARLQVRHPPYGLHLVPSDEKSFKGCLFLFS